MGKWINYKRIELRLEAIPVIRITGSVSMDPLLSSSVRYALSAV